MNALALSVAALLSLAACGTTPPVPAPEPLAWPADIADLRWLAGRWITADPGPSCVVEHWLGEDSTLWVTIIAGDGSHGAYRVYRPAAPTDAPLTLLDVSGDDVIEFQASQASARAIRFVRTTPSEETTSTRSILAYVRNADELTVTQTDLDGTVRTANLSPAADALETCR